LVVELLNVTSTANKPLLFLVEGLYDIEFLTILADRLQGAGLGVPNLSSLVAAKQLLFIPTGGGSPRFWTTRLAPLQCRELHPYDRESGEEEKLRHVCAEIVNQRPGCRAFVTEKRSVENYLHPAAIEGAGGGEFRYRDDDHLGACVAQDWYERTPQGIAWESLSSRSRSRLIQRAKKWLNTIAVNSMTAALLEQQDPSGQLLQVFQTAAELLI
jgi:hypothetical protein